jgi:hypothetical protein
LGRGGEFVIRRNSSDGRRNRLQRIRVEDWVPGEVLSLVERWAGGVLEIERRFQLTESGTTTKVSITETRRGAAAPILRHQGGRIERSLDAFVDGIDIELKRSDRPRLDLSPLDLRIAVQLSRSDATAEAVAASLPEPARLVHQAVAALQHRGVITSTIDMNSQGRTEIVYSTTEFGAVLLAQSVAQTR